MVVVLAHIFEQLDIRAPAQVKAATPNLRICVRIVDRHFVLDRVEVRASETFNGVKFGRMRKAGPIDPEVLAKTDRIHDQRLAFLMSDGVAVLRRFKICRMLLGIHENRPEGVRSSHIEDIHALQFRYRYEVYAVWRLELASNQGWMATGISLQFSNLPLII